MSKEPDFSTEAVIGKGKYQRTVFFPEDSAPSVTLITLNKKAPRWQRTEVIRKEIPLEARRQYNEKRQEWLATAADRAEEERQEMVAERLDAVARMKRSIGLA